MVDKLKISLLPLLFLSLSVSLPVSIYWFEFVIKLLADILGWYAGSSNVTQIAGGQTKVQISYPDHFFLWPVSALFLPLLPCVSISPVYFSFLPCRIYSFSCLSCFFCLRRSFRISIRLFSVCMVASPVVLFSEEAWKLNHAQMFDVWKQKAHRPPMLQWEAINKGN